jgi:predicted GNAT family N-acyltransferase
VHIVEISPTATHPLRRSVLRDGTASDVVVFDGDDLPTTFHLGAMSDDGILIGISSWMERRYPDLPALSGSQLRGMATDPAVRGTGAGAAMLAAGVARCADGGIDVVWARARISALGFYVAHGFEPRGPEYTDLTTGLPHVDIVRRL